MTYRIGQRLEICNFPDVAGYITRGEVVVVVHPQGFDPEFPQSYGVLFGNGKVRGVNPQFLRLRFGVPDINRADVDNPSTWEQFEKTTGVSRMSIIVGRPSKDY